MKKIAEQIDADVPSKDNVLIEPSSTLSDESLAAAAHQGSEPAFEQLFERHWRRVAHIAGRFFNRSDKIDEIVQESFTKMFFALGDYTRDRGSSFAAWFSRIAINACYDQLRRLKRRPEQPMLELDQLEAQQLRAQFNNDNAEANTISRDLAEKLLSNLSAEDRWVLTLLEVEELSVSEIASITGWSESKVKVRVHRARLALREILHQYL